MLLDKRDYLKNDLYKVEIAYKENGELVFVEKVKSFFKKDEVFDKFPDLKYLPVSKFYSNFYFYLFCVFVGLLIVILSNFSFLFSLVSPYN